VGRGHAAEAKHLGKGVLERDIEKQFPDASAEIIMYCGGGLSFRRSLATWRSGWLQKRGVARRWLQGDGPGRLADDEVISRSPVLLTGMATQPPPLPSQKNLRLASALNMFLPGAGLIYIGRRVLGAVLAGMFLCCFPGGDDHFPGRLQPLPLDSLMSENLMEGNKLEEAGASFHQNWVVGLALTGGNHLPRLGDLIC